ncbi:hypothetical protein BP5796_08696 [Coleophoma crateriformis]|uniref:Zn(2)-C6 fungal-type domain-containing protein n=1 Tax=Coleophoma crateriformis TaxID=565419 RepID=A0A3D8R8C9_9HELO|nr:hypothetical protein BP5796_08696 [Coleophoma crateriformis]
MVKLLKVKGSSYYLVALPNSEVLQDFLTPTLPMVEWVVSRTFSTHSMEWVAKASTHRGCTQWGPMTHPPAQSLIDYCTDAVNHSATIASRIRNRNGLRVRGNNPRFNAVDISVPQTSDLLNITEATSRMDSTTTSARPGRRSNACRRCRQRKIRCTGSQPCANCSRRNFDCIIDDEGRRIVVSQRYLRELQQAAGSERTQAERASKESESGHATLPQLPAPGDVDNRESLNLPSSHGAQVPVTYLHQVQTNPPVPQVPTLELVNPLATTNSSYLSDGAGRPRSLGESSLWACSRRALDLIRSQLDSAESPEIQLNEESLAYHLSWGSHVLDNESITSDLPSIDHALYLLNGVKFHVGQMYHLFDENEFMTHFHEFYKSPAEISESRRIWFVHFLALLALGKAVSVAPLKGATSPPGANFFLRAMNLLPDASYLFRDALTAIEALCVISLYLQLADMRNSAFIHIGQALRMALVFGLHRDRPLQKWDEQATARCIEVWWTVYILDRDFTSTMGVPTSINDNDITTPMPQPQGYQKNTALHLHVRLSRLVAQVVNKCSLPFDLERIFSAAFVHLMSSFITPGITNPYPLREEFILVLDELVARGSVPARFRKADLEALENMMRQWDTSKRSNESINGFSNYQGADSMHQHIPSQASLEEEDSGATISRPEQLYGGLSDGLSIGQILNVAQIVDVQQDMLNPGIGWAGSWLWENEESFGVSDNPIGFHKV